MSLYLIRDDGTGQFFPGQGGVDLLTIANMDTGYGETDNPLDPKGVQITYVRSDSGIPAQRLDRLVNDATLSDDIIIFPVTASFALADGTLISSVGGIAIPVGNALNPTASDIATFYDTSDCDGHGWYVFDTSSNKISLPTSVILYHELAHCFHFATGVPSTEPLAETDENDLRDQLGLTHRDINNHGGGCGGGPSTPCCVVASIASGSAFSSEVAALRGLRDKLLRRGRLGEDFFNRLHKDYYGFSPEVCFLMAERSELVPFVHQRFVLPLILGLQLLRHFSEHPDDAAGLGRLVASQLEDPRAATLYQAADLRFTSELLTGDLATASPDPEILGEDRPAGLPELAGLLGPGIESSYIRWALLDVVALWSEGAAATLEGQGIEEIGELLQRRFRAWAGFLPLSPIWLQFSPIEARLALNELAELLFHSPESRATLTGRLSELRPDLKGVFDEFVGSSAPWPKEGA